MMKTIEKRSDPFLLSKSRFESFSDGVFAIAITLLILEVRLPPSVSSASASWEQTKALIEIWPQYLVYAASFATIGIMWLNHHALFTNVRRITHGITIANLGLLGLISFLPFTTEVLGRFGFTPPAVVYYGLTMIAISVAYNVVLRQVTVAHPESARPFFLLWNIVGMTAYPAATILGFFIPALGVGMIGLLALFYMLPRNVASVVLEPQRDGA